jgi:hypothetical protein
MVVGGLVVGIIVDEAREAVGASCDVDGLEEVGERFAESLDIIVCWLAEEILTQIYLCSNHSQKRICSMT